MVEAGKPVQVTLTNADAMPHNIVFGQPGSVKTIGELAATMPPPADLSARAYIPDSPLVLQATRLVQRGESDTIKFTAPTAPGEYSFLCSFPGHYVRMYGVMLVVPLARRVRGKPDVAERSAHGAAAGIAAPAAVLRAPVASAPLRKPRDVEC